MPLAGPCRGSPHHTFAAGGWTVLFGCGCGTTAARYDPGPERHTMKHLKKLTLDVDALRVDTFQAIEQEKGTGTVNAHATAILCSGACTGGYGSCNDCYTASAERPYCY
jgi:hypothetical protein